MSDGIYMREERRQISGNQLINEPIELWGAISGKVSVVEGGKLYVRGAIYGDLIVHDGGRVHVFGNISGRVMVKEGAKVIISGVIGGDVINSGGRLFIDESANLMSRLKRKAGETEISPRARIKEK